MSQSDASKDVFKLNSQDGAQLCRKIARPQLGFDPHSYSLDVATTVMDGINALVTSKCGSGKTGILALLAICIARFGEENSLLPANCRKDFVSNPIILVVCPTDSLEVDLVCIFGFTLVTALTSSSCSQRSSRNTKSEPWSSTRFRSSSANMKTEICGQMQ